MNAEQSADASERPLDGLVGQFSTGVVHRKDETLRSIITLALGEGWTLESLRGRLLTKRYPDGIEVVCIDGKEAAKFHPLRFEQVIEDGMVKLKATQSYRILLPNRVMYSDGGRK